MQVALAEAAVVVASAAVAFLHLRNAFFVSNDDLLQFHVADENGLSRELLTLNVFGHFGPLNRLGHLVFMRWAHLDLTAGAVAATLLVVLLCLTALWCAHELHLSPTRRLLVTGATGFSAAVLDSAVWMDTALHTLLALIATYLVLAAHLRALNTGRARWHVLSVLVFATGLLVQSRPGLALPLIVLVDVLLVAAGWPWRRRLALLRGVTVPLVAMAVIGATVALMLRAFYIAPGSQPTLDVLLQTLWIAFTTVLFPSLLGLVPLTVPPVGVQILGAVLIAGAATVLVARRRGNAEPLLFVGAVFLLYYGFLAFSPILSAETMAASAIRISYAVYVLVPVLLGLAHVRLGGGGGGDVRAAGWRRHGRRAVVVGLLGILVVTGVLYTGQRWDRARAGHDYLQAVDAARAQWTADDTTVVPVKSPEPVAGSWVEELGRHESLLPMLERGWTPGPVRDRLVVIDPDGRLRPVTLREVARGGLPEVGDAEPGCLRARPGIDRLTFPLDRAVRDEPLFAMVSYELAPGGDVDVVKTTGISWDARGQWALTTRPVTLTPGRQTVLVPLRVDALPEVAQVALGNVTVGADLCVRELTVVSPLYVEDDGCSRMDQYGVRGSRIPC